MMDKNHSLAIAAQCRLLDVPRSTFYYSPAPTSDRDIELMHLIDKIHTKLPFYGSRRIRYELQAQGFQVGRDHVLRLMRLMDIAALYPKPKTSRPNLSHSVYPYLLKNLKITRADCVWAADITYPPMEKGFCYLVAVMDWASRRVLSWRVSNTLDTSFCLEALQEALDRFGFPEIFNTDQGCQFTSDDFQRVLKDAQIKISMDGRGRWIDNVFIERLWRSVKYEDVYLKAYETIPQLKAGLREYFDFYNLHRPHQGLDERTPDRVYWETKDQLRATV